MLHKILEAMVLAGQYEWALQEAGHISLEDLSQPSPAASVSVWACRAATHLERWGQVVVWAERGLEDRPVDPEQEGILHLCKARALINLGDLPQAEEELQAFLSLAERTEGLRCHEADALYCLGRVHQLLHRNHLAIKAFSKASGAYSSGGEAVLALQSRYQVAWTYLVEGLPEPAWAHLKAVQSGLLAYSDRTLELDTLIATALYHSLCGDRAGSERICLALLDDTGLPQRQAAEIAWILGHNALADGNPTCARGYLDIAYHAAVEDWSPCQLDRIRQLRDRIEQGMS